MPNRAARRAAERKAAELARKANPETIANTATLLNTAFDFSDEENAALPLSGDQIHGEKTFAAAAGAGVSDCDSAAEPVSEPAKAAPISDARLNANRANAQHSSGPRTQTGKAKSSLNAVKTGLTGQTVVLSTDDAHAYQAHIDRHFAKYSPATDDEHTLVQSIADTEWRLLRIPPLEAAVYALGQREFANEFDDEENPATRASLILGKTMLHYRRDLSNLTLQERRLRNHLEKDKAALAALQQARIEKRKNQIALCVKQGNTFNPADVGFDFSIHELNLYLDRTSTQFCLTGTRPGFDNFLSTHRAERLQTL